MAKKILIASDGSEFTSGAVREAINAARACGAQLHAMVAVQTNPEYEALAPQLVEKADRDARVHLEEIQRRAASAGVGCEISVRHGAEPYREVVDAAAEVGADLLVIGRRGRTGLMHLMMGSTAYKIIGHANCAVLVVPRAAQVFPEA